MTSQHMASIILKFLLYYVGFIMCIWVHSNLIMAHWIWFAFVFIYINKYKDEAYQRPLLKIQEPPVNTTLTVIENTLHQALHAEEEETGFTFSPS